MEQQICEWLLADENPEVKLSVFRSAGALTFYSEGLKISSWHKENLDATLEALRNL